MTGTPAFLQALCKTEIEVGEIDQDCGGWRCGIDLVGETPKDPVERAERSDRFERTDDRGVADVSFQLHAGVAHALLHRMAKHRAAGKLAGLRARATSAPIHVARSLAGDDQESVRTHGNFLSTARTAVSNPLVRVTHSAHTEGDCVPTLPSARTLYSPSGRFLKSNLPSAELLRLNFV